MATALSIIAAAYAALLYRTLPSQTAQFRDFNAYYVPALAVRHGLDPYGIGLNDLYREVGGPLGDLDLGHNHLGDTPQWFIMMAPLTLLSPHAAYWTWFWICAGALAASLLVLLHDSCLGGAGAVALAALAVMYGPVADNFWFGQSEVFLLLIFVLMLRALGRGWDRTAGLLLAAASLLRAYPIAMVAYLVMRRRWRALAYTVAGCVLGALATIALLGWRVCFDYLLATGLLHGGGIFGATRALDQPIEFLRHPGNLNLAWAVKFPFDHTGRHPRALPSLLGAAAEAALLVAAVFATRRLPADDPYWSGYSLWIITVTLLSPIAWVHFLVCFIPLFIGTAAAARDGVVPRGLVWSAVAAYALILTWPSAEAIVPVIQAAGGVLLGAHPHLRNATAEVIPLSLMLTWLAAWWLVPAASIAAGTGKAPDYSIANRLEPASSKSRDRAG